MFETKDNVSIEYVNTCISGELKSEFKVIGLYKGKYINEVVVIGYNDIIVPKNLEHETQKYQFLTYIKELKDNKDSKEVKIKLSELALKQSSIKEKDIEYFKLVYELVNVNVNKKKTVADKYSDKKGRFVDIRV